MTTDKRYPLYHAKFVYYYILDPMKNATNALAKARPGLKNRNGEATAAAKLMQMPHIKKMIADLEIDIEGQRDDVVAKSKKILDELEMVGFFDLRKMFDHGTEERAMLDKLGDEARAVSRIKIKKTKYRKKDVLDREEDVEIDVWIHDKMKALELRGKNLKLYTDVVADGGKVVSPEIYSLPDNGTKGNG